MPIILALRCPPVGLCCSAHPAVAPLLATARALDARAHTHAGMHTPWPSLAGLVPGALRGESSKASVGVFLVSASPQCRQWYFGERTLVSFVLSQGHQTHATLPVSLSLRS